MPLLHTKMIFKFIKMVFLLIAFIIHMYVMQRSFSFYNTYVGDAKKLQFIYNNPHYLACQFENKQRPVTETFWWKNWSCIHVFIWLHVLIWIWLHTMKILEMHWISFPIIVLVEICFISILNSLSLFKHWFNVFVMCNFDRKYIHVFIC